MLTKQADVLSMFARNGDVEAVDTMIERGADVNSVDSNGNTPLSQALEASHFRLALDLIDRGAKSDLGNRSEGCLTVAIIRGNVDVVKALLSHGASPDKSPYPTIENAAAVGSLELVKLLLAHGAAINRQDVLGGNAVLQAVGSGKTDLLRYLLEHGGNPNVREQDGETPLTQAVLRGHEEMIPLLLAHGADVRRTNGGGYTALDLTADGWHPETFVHLKAAWMKLPPAQRKRIGQASTDSSPHPDAHSQVAPPRKTPKMALLEATSEGDAEAVRALLSHGVSAAGRPWDDDSPLYLGVRSRNATVVRLLIDHGAPLEERLPVDNTPICRAALWGEMDIVKLLIDLGANVNPENVSNPPLTATRDSGIVKLLLDHHADVDARDSDGATALWHAADLDDPSITATLLAHGASVEAADQASGDTPLIRAARVGRDRIVSLLLAKGADPAVANFAGQSAFDVAGDGYHPKTLAILHAGAGTGVASVDVHARHLLWIGVRFMPRILDKCRGLRRSQAGAFDVDYAVRATGASPPSHTSAALSTCGRRRPHVVWNG